MLTRGGLVLVEISALSPRKLFIFIILKNKKIDQALQQQQKHAQKHWWRNIQCVQDNEALLTKRRALLQARIAEVQAAREALLLELQATHELATAKAFAHNQRILPQVENLSTSDSVCKIKSNTFMVNSLIVHWIAHARSVEIYSQLNQNGRLTVNTVSNTNDLFLRCFNPRNMLKRVKKKCFLGWPNQRIGWVVFTARLG